MGVLLQSSVDEPTFATGVHYRPSPGRPATPRKKIKWWHCRLEMSCMGWDGSKNGCSTSLDECHEFYE